MGDRGPGAVTKQHLQAIEFRPVIWDEHASRAEKVIQFIEQLRLTADPWTGEPFLLRDWQKAIIRAWYRTDEEGRLIVRTGLLSVGRKNGKTGLVAALALCHLCGPEAVQRGQIVVGATDSDQSGLIFNELVAFIEDNREFASVCKIKSHEKIIKNTKNGTEFKALSSDAKKAHGLNPSVVILDELAQWGDGVGRRLFDALTTGSGVRRDPVKFIIGTQSDEDSALMSQLVDYAEKVNAGEVEDDKFSGFVHRIPDDMDVFDEKNWILANPAIDDFRSREDMRDLAQKARRLPTIESTYRNLFCNQRTMTEPGLITKAEWQRCFSETERLQKSEEIYLAADLAYVADLCAIAAVSANNNDRVKLWFWKPGDLIKEHTEKDHLPYDQWVKEGWIQAPKGRTVDYRHIATVLSEIHRDYRVLGLAYDRYRVDVLKSELDRFGITCRDPKQEHGAGFKVFPWGQGYADMAPAVDAFEVSILEGRLKHDGNPVLTVNVANAKVDMDAAGNRKLDKSATRFRIDGAVALAMAIGLKARHSGQAKMYQVMFV